MKCPYRTITTHKPNRTEGVYTKYPQDIVDFADCYKQDCPFYKTIDRCLKAEREKERK